MVKKIPQAKKWFDELVERLDNNISVLSLTNRVLMEVDVE
jgi:hypothetical protein